MHCRCGTVDSVYGPTYNVWGSQFDLRQRSRGEIGSARIAGGSSGGSAVAVATSACFA